MKTRFIGRGIALGILLLLFATLPAIASADGLESFTASGAIVQTGPGVTSVAPLSAAEPYVPPAMYAAVAASVPFGPATPGELTPGQAFDGRLTSSTWGALKKADVDIAHNSWFTADIATLLTDPNVTSVPVIGLAWGTFDVTKKRNFVTSGYAAVIQGILSQDPLCYAPITNPYALSISVTDAGGWAVVPGTATGAYQEIVGGGDLVVSASGCLRQETASLTVSGTHGELEGDNDGHDHGDNDGHDHGDNDGHDHGDNDGHDHGDNDGHDHGDNDGHDHGDK